MTNFWQLIFSALPRWEWLALVWFFFCWIGYARFAKRRSTVQPSLLAEGNRERRQWMIESTRRDVRVIDAIVVQNLSTSPSFFASTTLLIVGAADWGVIELNEKAYALMGCEKKLILVPGATHLFEEPGTLQLAAGHAADWFAQHL